MAEMANQRDNFKSSLILIYAAVIPAVFICYGSADFIGSHLAALSGIEKQFYYFLSSFVLFGITPLAIWYFGFRQKLSEMGLGSGNIKQSLIWLAIGLPVMAILAYFSAQNPAFQAEYPLYRELLQNRSAALTYWLIYGFYYIGWEFFFRGFMLFGLESKFGQWPAILIQTIPSCLIHIGKPDAEIFSSIIAGIAFGWAALRCRSLWPILICHYALAVLLDLFIIYG